MTDRAVSNTLGFVFVFSLIVLTASIVSVSGFGALEGVRDAERINNAERAFDVLADNMADIQHENAPSRSTEIKLADASLGLGAPTEIQVTVGGTSYPSSPVQTRPVVFSAADTEIVYVAGAVMREEPSGAVMLREPSFLVTADHTAIQLPGLRSSDDSTMSGSTTVLVRAVKTNSKVLTTQTGSYSVAIEVETTPTRAETWRRYFQDQSACSVGGTGGTATCTYTTTGSADVVLSRTTVQVELSG
jgi:hypothetical protein